MKSLSPFSSRLVMSGASAPTNWGISACLGFDHVHDGHTREHGSEDGVRVKLDTFGNYLPADVRVTLCALELDFYRAPEDAALIVDVGDRVLDPARQLTPAG